MTTQFKHQRRFLIIGSYAGSFYKRLGAALCAEGASVWRVCLTGGDHIEWGWRDALVFRGRLSGFGHYLADQFKTRDITDIIVFGDVVPYHQEAIAQARLAGVHVHILENGYFRPAWVTLEHEGVNAFSSLPRDPDYYRTQSEHVQIKPSIDIGAITPHHVFAYIRHYAFFLALWWLYARYSYPFSHSVSAQAMGSVRRYIGLRLLGRRKKYERVETELMQSGVPFFLAFLQREGDSSITVHSDLHTVTDFIDHVIASFAANAPKDCLLVVKNHPLDPNVSNLARAARVAALRNGVEERIVYLDGGSFPELTRAARGTVTVNSTAAIAAMGFGVPAKILGRAFFDIEGLVDHQPLDQFWANPISPDEDLYKRFHRVVLDQVQIAGSFHNPEQRDATAARLAQAMMAWPRGATESRGAADR